MHLNYKTKAVNTALLKLDIMLSFNESILKTKLYKIVPFIFNNR